MTISLILLTLLIGAMLSVYMPMIARSAQLLGSTPLANVPFFAIALVSSVVISFAYGDRFRDYARIPGLPLWLLTAGIMSATMIIGTSYLVPRIGIGTFFVLIVTGQLLAGLTFSYFGLFGAPAIDITFGKIAGIALVIFGAWLFTFR
ncbi:DMT family transporter [Algicella marina]|uniref:EamA-like transporter family protein n=1 Tax=Algicella marina TaxID=2683284 RepID=A0A6P1T5Y1_9RHOB|nr:DMT family transporter [Algicella marina]QHQ37113.1 hypothetical protein GO499_18965 [Algicella marina]